MKVRSGFVSNSSSSSFILVFDELPGSAEELEEMLHFSGASAEYPKEKYAKQVFADINSSEPDDDTLSYLISIKMMHSVMGDWWNEDDRDKRMALYKKRRQKLERVAYDELAKFKKQNDGKVVRVVTYGDEDGPFFAELEHGGLFDNIKHVYVSQH